MPIAVPASSRIPGYDLDAPTEDTAVAALTRVFGAERARTLWGDVCRSARLEPGSVNTMKALESAIQALADEGGAAATVARSLTIRMRTHAQLAARRATPASGDGR